MRNGRLITHNGALGNRWSALGRSLTAWGLAASICLVVPGLAQAQEAAPKSRILIVPMQRGPNVSSVVPGRIFEYFRTVLGMNQRLHVMTPVTLAAPEVDDTAPVVIETDPIVTQADEKLEAGKAAMDAKKYLDAVNAFKKARELYEKRFAALADFDKYVDAVRGIGLGYFFAGYDDNGEDALATVLVLRPSFILDRRVVPEEAMQALDRLKKLYATPEKGKIKVTVTPSDATILLDGNRLGSGEATATGLLRGKHVIRVVREGHEPQARVVIAKSVDQALTFDLKSLVTESKEDKPLPASPEGLAMSAQKGEFGADYKTLAASISSAYQLDAIVMTYIRRAPKNYEIATFMYEANVGETVELDWVEIDHDLATMQINLLALEERILQTLAVFPRTRIVRARSAIYDQVLVEEPVVATGATGGATGTGTGTATGATAGTGSTPGTGATSGTTGTAGTGGTASGGGGTTATTPAGPGTGGDGVAGQTTPPGGGEGSTSGDGGATTGSGPDGEQVAGGTSVVVRPPVDDGAGGLGTYGSEEPWGVEGGQVEEDDQWYEKWWVWTIVGVAVAGGATAAILLTQEDSSEATFATVVQWGGSN